MRPGGRRVPDGSIDPAALIRRAFFYGAARPQPGMARPRNDTFLRALLREPTPYTPVWIMRQAGRYLPEYNRTRARAGSFLDLCRNPNLATEVTLQPLSRFGLDAAILFSDILTIPDAMGLGLHFVEGEGPRFEHPVRTEREIRDLIAPEPSQLQYVLDAVSQIRTALANEVPLIGFAGSPFTLACYMIEGRSGTDFGQLKQLLYREPNLLHALLQVNTRAVIAYLNAQIECGAQAVMVFDTWGGILSAGSYETFSLGYLRQIVAGLRREHDGERVPCIVFTKGGGAWLDRIAAIGCEAIGLDWTVDIGAARAQVGECVALQGNMDPAILLTTPAIVQAEVMQILQSFGAGNGHVFNLGHGVNQYTPPDNVQALVDAVHAGSRPYHV